MINASIWARLGQPIEGPIATPVLRALKWSLTVVVLLVVGVAVDRVLSVGAFYNMRGMEQSLRLLVTVQDSLFTARGRYVDDLDSLGAYWAAPGGQEVEIRLTPAGDGWGASLRSASSDDPLGCAIYVGPVVDPPSSPLGVRPTEPRTVACDPPGPVSRFFAALGER